MNSRFSVSQAIKEGFGKTVDHIGVLVKGLFFLCVAILLVVMGLAIINIGFIAALWNLSPLVQNIQVCGSDATCVQLVLAPLIELLRGNLLTLFFISTTFFIGFSYLTIGFENYALRVYDVGNAEFSDLFPSLGRVFKIMIARIIYTAMVFCGLVLLVIPGVYLYFRFSMAIYFVLDKNVGVFDSLKMSWRITRGYCWDLFALFLFGVLLSALGKLTVIGLFFVLPMIYVIDACVYRRLLAAYKSNHDLTM